MSPSEVLEILGLTTQDRQVDLDDNLRVWRTFQMGKLLVCSLDALAIDAILGHIEILTCDSTRI